MILGNEKAFINGYKRNIDFFKCNNISGKKIIGEGERDKAPIKFILGS